MKLDYKKDFYDRFLQYHTHKVIINLFRDYLPKPKLLKGSFDNGHGLVFRTRKNEWRGEDRKKFPNTHPVQEYALVYGHRGTGFSMRLYWKGDFFFHLTHVAFRIEDELPIYSGKERGGRWSVLDAFPDLTTGELDDQIDLALRTCQIRINKEIRKYNTMLNEKNQALELIISALGQ